MDAQNTEIEIDLVRLFKYILSKWKVLLVSGVILSVLAFSYKFYGFNYSKVPLAQINKLFDIERLKSKVLREDSQLKLSILRTHFYIP